MKVLYISCHAILEYDELKMFEELGLDYFALGSYLNPQKPVDPIRPALNNKPHDDLIAIAPPREKIPKEFIDKFDVVMLMDGHPTLGWLDGSWENMKHKRVILRMIGQSTPTRELRIKEYRDKGVQVVRYSPREERMANYAGADAMIRFGKDENEFAGWHGSTAQVLNFTQNLQARGESCHHETTINVMSRIPGAKIYGPNNEVLGSLNGGLLPYETMKEKYKSYRAYFYNGTQPACYTLTFIEALMAGIPMVCIGPDSQRITKNICGEVYEIPDLIQHGSNGYVTDDINQMVYYIQLLLSDHGIAKRMSDNARATGIRHFGKENIKKQWAQFLHI